ncbi:MAG: helix-turn-helix transcriptional regulator [Georgfuchsia sp.]
MSNMATLLKEEIARAARKEVRIETEKLKKSSAQYRSNIAGLKRRVTELEKQVSRLNKNATKTAVVPAAPSTPSRVRFSAKGLLAQRQRLGLSAADLGTLLGVSQQTIYNWASEISRPRQKQMIAIAGLRGLSKTQAQARVKELAGS